MNGKVNKKNIVIEHYGILHTLGGLHGPILEPFSLDVESIRHLVITKKKVIEVLPDGTRVKLDRRNFDRDNTDKQKSLQEQKIPAPVAPPKEKEEKKQNNKEFTKDNRNQDGGGKQKQNNKKNQDQ